MLHQTLISEGVTSLSPQRRGFAPVAGGKGLKARRALESLYFEQRCALEARFKQQAIDVRVADYALAAPWHAPPFSYCVWTRRVVVLLPETDFVVLSAVETKSSGYREAIVPWNELLRVTGDACFVGELDLIPYAGEPSFGPRRRC
jgi:hypothetical protein